MNIAIIGYGKMGKMIEMLALEAGHNITCIIDPLLSRSSLGEKELYKTIEDAEKLKNADVAIEFSMPDTALANISALAKRKIPIVIGTTGWYEKLDDVEKIINTEDTSVIWSANFSIGVYIFYQIAWYASQLIDHFPEYDVGGFEVHHNKKTDSPSGTAKMLVEGIISRTNRKEKAVWETLNRKLEANELHFSSLRIGSVIGKHSLIFDSHIDTIEITHTAKSREGFAIGAIRAASWLIDKERRGVFTMDEMLMDILGN